MEEHTLDFSDYMAAFRRRRLSIFVIATIIFVIGALAALLWPPTYQSSATILIKEQDIPPELVQSTVTSFASQRIQAISQKVMARINLLEIIDRYDLYGDDRERLTSEEMINEMRDNIGLELIDAEVVDPRTGRPTAATIAFQLSFKGKYPEQVQKVANELMSLYLKENLKERAEKATEAYSFLSGEADRLNKKIAQLEGKLAIFKEQHVNSLPELAELNLQLMDRTEREVTDVENQIRSEQQTRIYLQAQLAQVSPYGADVSLDPATRLQALRTEYFGLAARYSRDHPDVVRMRREIESLEQETGAVDSSALQVQKLEALRAELASLSKKYADEHPDVIKLKREIESLEKSAPTAPPRPARASSATNSPSNPAYIQLQGQIEAADTTIRSLQEKRKQLRDKLAEYEKRLLATPQVEREYQSLQRDLQNAVNEYQEIHAKLMAAQIAQELEKGSRGERFEIIEPPVLPEAPISPNRPAILFLSFVLALGCGIGYAAMSESLDDSVHSSKSLALAVGAAPLAVIPYQRTDSEISKRRWRITAKATAAAAAVILAIAMVHYFWTPLDVLWYKALRKADIVINT